MLSGKQVASAQESVDVVAAFIKDIGMAIPLGVQGVKESDFDESIAGATGYMAGGMELDPVPVTPEDVRKVLEESL